MAKLEIKLQGLEVRAEGEAAFAALRSFAGMFGQVAGSFSTEEEAGDEGKPGAESEEEFETEEDDEAEAGEEDDEPEAVGVTESAMKVLRSEANKAGGKGVWFQPPAISDMAIRAGISVDQFRSAFAYLKKSGRIECDSAAASRPKPIRVPLEEDE